MGNSFSKFIEIKSDNGDLIKNQRLEFCREKNIPYVTVNSGNKFADVLWDHISYSMESEKIFNQNEEYLKTEFLNIYNKYGKNNSEFSISCMTASFAGLLIEDAKAAANDIFDLINDLIVKNSH